MSRRSAEAGQVRPEQSPGHAENERVEEAAQRQRQHRPLNQARLPVGQLATLPPLAPQQQPKQQPPRQPQLHRQQQVFVVRFRDRRQPVLLGQRAVLGFETASPGPHHGMAGNQGERVAIELEPGVNRAVPLFTKLIPKLPDGLVKPGPDDGRQGRGGQGSAQHQPAAQPDPPATRLPGQPQDRQCPQRQEARPSLHQEHIVPHGTGRQSQQQPAPAIPPLPGSPHTEVGEQRHQQAMDDAVLGDHIIRREVVPLKPKVELGQPFDARHRQQHAAAGEEGVRPAPPPGRLLKHLVKQRQQQQFAVLEQAAHAPFPAGGRPAHPQRQQGEQG